ncbi:thermonuclease family protein [uncultured Desulfobulbus sp.]|uniref:thermonuclease family protein n=1 Tax=uncultured Desulfobulbus sp. TaxID=239745 RepID=UPI0029C6DF8B|nr:thermonuclease family protein [uncultured Desulfobulbus sp.]
MKLLNILFLLISLVLSPAFNDSSQAETITAKVVSVTDGDTIIVSGTWKSLEIRFFGIDTPEKSQAFGQEAKDFTSSMLSGRKVRVEPITKDHYGRTVAMVYADDINLNEQIVAQGFGWMYRKYCEESFCYDWLKLEEAAKAAHKGLWADANPVPPWEFRHEQRSGGSSSAAGVALPSGNPQALPTGSAEYHGNVNSHVFHGPGCVDYNCKNCTVRLKSAQEAINAGYRAHKECVR